MKESRELTDGEKAEALAAEDATLDAASQAERDRHAAEASARQLDVDRARAQERAVNDQRAATARSRPARP